MAELKEVSLAGLVRRGLEYMLSIHPLDRAPRSRCKLDPPSETGLPRDPFADPDWRVEVNMTPRTEPNPAALMLVRWRGKRTMISCDTNVLFPALEASHLNRARARSFLESQIENPDFALCELVLMEVHVLPRNPRVAARPLDAARAVRRIDNLRRNPHWVLLDYPGGLMDDVWTEASRSSGYRGIFDIRLALALRHHGVGEFATANPKDFQGFDFERLWNPLTASQRRICRWLWCLPDQPLRATFAKTGSVSAESTIKI